MFEALTLEVIDPAMLGGGVAAVIFFGVIVFLVLGRRLGNRVIARHGATAMPNVGSLETAVFALLGLLIAFSFSGALSRFDVRRAQAVQEANAIGTAYLRIGLLPDSAQPRLRDSLRAYADSRIATYRKLPDVAAARLEWARSRELQGEIWAQAVAAARLPGVRPGTEVLLFPALNDMFDITIVRVVAMQLHPPTIIYWMLGALALAAALLAGYQSAGEPGYDWLHKICFAGIVAFTVYVILDIEHPRLGLVRIDSIDKVLIDVRAGMK
ncbi:MAG TPA: DUF4239 domain-containing protein [Burkholderiales bacterium]|nr:DUF4239 domain-containing protein [Burkholderiales bacterium]